MGKKTPKAPAVPDPNAVAAAQGQMNKETAISNAYLNRINQYSPEGSIEYNQVGTNPDGTPKFESRQTYSPEQQALYNNQNQVSQALSNTALKATGNVDKTLGTPWDSSGFTPIQTGAAGAGTAKTGYDPGGTIRTGFDAGGPIARSFAGGGNIQDSYASGGDIQRNLDYSKLAQIPGIGDYGAEAKRVQDAVYNQATSRLDPRFEADQRKYAATLAAKGVTENSQAYRNAMDDFGRTKNDAYNQATYSGIQAGSQEQSRLFGLGLAGRQQGVSEINSQGGFANAAQAQAEAQNAARAGFGNEAQQQRFGQNAAQAAFGNEAQQQQYTQNLGQAAFGNEAQNQQNSQNAGQAAFYNTAQGQNFGQNLQNASFNNQARGQQASEAAYARSLPIQEIASLMGGGQMQQPNFANYNPVNVANTDYSGLVQGQYNNQLGQYQQQLAQRNSALGSVFGLAGSAMKMLPFSDRRLKHNIKQIGETVGGIKTYVFSYIGSKAREFGVMADEVFKVLPEAVGERNGYMTVDYGKVWKHGIAG